MMVCCDAILYTKKNFKTISDLVSTAASLYSCALHFLCGMKQTSRTKSFIDRYIREAGKTHPNKKLRHHHISLLTGSVQGRAGQSQRQERPGGERQAERGINVLLSAVGQKEQQLGEVVLHHCQEKTARQRDVWALARSGRRQRRHKQFLLIFGPDP